MAITFFPGMKFFFWSVVCYKSVCTVMYVLVEFLNLFSWNWLCQLLRIWDDVCNGVWNLVSNCYTDPHNAPCHNTRYVTPDTRIKKPNYRQTNRAKQWARLTVLSAWLYLRGMPTSRARLIICKLQLRGPQIFGSSVGHCCPYRVAVVLGT